MNEKRYNTSVYFEVHDEPDEDGGEEDEILLVVFLNSYFTLSSFEESLPITSQSTLLLFRDRALIKNIISSSSSNSSIEKSFSQLSTTFEEALRFFEILFPFEDPSSFP